MWFTGFFSLLHIDDVAPDDTIPATSRSGEAVGWLDPTASKLLTRIPSWARNRLSKHLMESWVESVVKPSSR